MTKTKIIAACAREHAELHSGMLSICFRVGVYSLALLGVMAASEHWFHDSYTANVSLFMLFAFVFELLWNKRHSGPRLWGTVLCVIGIGLFGLALVNQAVEVEAHCQEVQMLDSQIQEVKL